MAPLQTSLSGARADGPNLNVDHKQKLTRVVFLYLHKLCEVFRFDIGLRQSCDEFSIQFN